MKNVENEWDRLAILARRAGGLFPGSGIAVKSSNNETAIKPSWSRWLRSIHFLTYALFLLGPILIAYYIIPETSPDRYVLLVLAIFPTVGGLLVLRKGLLYSLRVGKINFSPDSSKITIHYGHLPFARKLPVSRDNLSVKMYLFKTPHKYTRLKYGQTIMSLLRPDQKEHELIIAAITRRSNALAAFEALRDFLGCGNLGDFATEAKVEGRDSIFGFESNEWNHLSEKSRTKSPFFGSMRRKSISIKQYPDKLILKWFWDRWIMALFLLAFSGFCYFGAYYLFEISIRGFFFLLSGLGLGTLFGYPGLRILLTAEKITLNNWNSTINIRSGFFPFTNSLTVSTEQIRVRIYRCHNSHANKAMKPGYTLLSLLNNKTPNLEFILAAASKKSLLTPAYEMLIEFLKQPFCDETLEEIELSDGQVINVSTDALTGGGDAQDKKRSFRLLSTNSVSFSRNWNNIIVGFSLAGLMLMGLIAALCSGDNGEEPSIGGKIFLVTLGLAFFALGAGFAIYSWRTRHIIVDKMNDIVSYKGFINSPSKGKLLCAISDIAAVQVCSVLGTITSGQSSREITVYEINVVLKNSGNKRINILASQNYSQIQDDATGFADFLGVPLLDHT